MLSIHKYYFIGYATEQLMLKYMLGLYGTENAPDIKGPSRVEKIKNTQRAFPSPQSLTTTNRHCRIVL